MQTRILLILFPQHFKAGFQRVFEPFRTISKGFQVFQHSKGFQELLQIFQETNQNELVIHFETAF